MDLSLPIPLTRTPLEASDEVLLCGRASEVETIAENCRLTRLTVLTSAPGLGVSSLLRAGAVPALGRAGYITVIHSNWEGRSVASQLRAAVERAVHEQADGAFIAGSDQLCHVIAHAQATTGRRVAILLDQFEDYLRTHAGTDTSDDFDAELSTAVNAHAGCFVIGLHTQAMAAFERLSQYIPNLLGYRIALQPLDREAGKEICLRAAAQENMALELAAVDLMIAAPLAAASEGVNPLFLKLAADRLFLAERNLKSKVARASTLEANGGAGRMILESLDPVINDLGSTHAELLFRWVPLMLGPDQRRLIVAEDALIAHAGKWNRFAMTLLPLLVKTGLLRMIAMPAGTRYEVARESMTAIIHSWWVRREADIVARRRAIFRVGSVSIAAGAILIAYIVYVVMTWKHP